MFDHALLRCWAFVLFTFVLVVAASSEISPAENPLPGALQPRAFTVSTTQKCTTVYCGSKPKSVPRTTVTVRKTARTTITRTRARATSTVLATVWSPISTTTVTRTNTISTTTVEVITSVTQTISQQTSYVFTTVYETISTDWTHGINPPSVVIPRSPSYTAVLADPDNAASRFPNKKRDASPEPEPKAAKFAKSVRCTKTLNSRTTSTVWRTTPGTVVTTRTTTWTHRATRTLWRTATAPTLSTIFVTATWRTETWLHTRTLTDTSTETWYTGTVTTIYPTHTHYAACDRVHFAPPAGESRDWMPNPGPIDPSWSANGWIQRVNQRANEGGPSWEIKCCDMCHALGNRCNGIEWRYLGHWGGPPCNGCENGPEPEIRAACYLYMAGSTPTCRNARWEKEIYPLLHPVYIANGPTCKMWKRRMPGRPL